MIITLNNNQELKFSNNVRIDESDNIITITHIESYELMPSIRNTVIDIVVIPKDDVKFIDGIKP